MAVPTRCILPVIRTWSLVAFDMKSGNAKPPGDNGGKWGSLPDKTHLMAWDTQGKIVEYSPSSWPFFITWSVSEESCNGSAWGWKPAPLKAIHTRWFSTHQRSWLSWDTVKFVKSVKKKLIVKNGTPFLAWQQTFLSWTNNLNFHRKYQGFHTSGIGVHKFDNKRYFWREQLTFNTCSIPASLPLGSTFAVLGENIAWLKLHSCKKIKVTWTRTTDALLS